MIVNDPSDFDFLEIGLASPERIRYWSHGEVEKPETINYRTFKPERKGLFCEKIFGPVKDWECSCGKYRRVRYRGIVCERCGVEVTHSKVRRERMGHIELAADVAHIWFLKGIPSYMGIVLDLSARQLEEVIYYDTYIVTEVDNSLDGIISLKQLIPVTEYHELKNKYPGQFKASMGASAIKEILMQIDLEKEVKFLREALETAKGQKKLKVTKRLRILDSLLQSGNRPEWMILEAVPIMPPDLRPMVQLEGGRFATSDLNDLYRRVVNRNNRLKRLMDIGAPEMIIRNEKRMLQESVDVLISNGKRGRSVTGSNGRPLKSLGNIIEGKQGRFRQNLLGKRVDYSGRSVIVVGPHLKFHQCGLPKEMALELFKPFIIRKLVDGGFVTNVKSAKRKIERKDIEVWDVLEEVIQGQPVLLNRAPTLHRLGIQAFEPVLVEGAAIQVHPLVCTAFNADFDGDQMAVHVPLSIEAQTECRLLILSTNNILAPSNGRSIVTPTQDMVLGIYFLTVINEEAELGKGKYFANIDEATRAWENKVIDIQAKILVKDSGNRYETSMGRLILNRAIRDVLIKYDIEYNEFINEVIGKKQLSDLVYKWFHDYGNRITAALVDHIKNIGFKYSTLSGISISIDDLIVPDSKKGILEKAEKEVRQLEKLEKNRSISLREKSLRSIDTWRGATAEIANAMRNDFGYLNNVFIMANSGARGNMDQVRQLAGMRGLMSDSQGRILEIPIKSNFKEGLSLTEYFNACYGARKGLVDTALRTADSGYLTRRLVDVAQDVLITQVDCETEEGLEMIAVQENGQIIVPLAEQIEGRIANQDIVSPSGEIIVNKGDLISLEMSQVIDNLEIKSVNVRHVYRCKATRGICQKCYGLDLGLGNIVSLGEAVGIIAAQSIGEPGTQLTMRTFHTGGVDLRKASREEIKAAIDGKVVFDDQLTPGQIRNEQGDLIWINAREGIMTIKGTSGDHEHFIPAGSVLLTQSNNSFKKDDVLAICDPTFEYVVSESDGIVKINGLELEERRDSKGNLLLSTAQAQGEVFVVNTSNESSYEIPAKHILSFKAGDVIKTDTELAPGVKVEVGGVIQKITPTKDSTVISIAAADSYPALEGAKLFVEDGQKVAPGTILLRELAGDNDASKTTDIVQGLPRIEELFEARRPKDAAILSVMAGIVEIHERDGLRYVTVRGEDGDKKEYKVPSGIRLKVFTGKKIEVGDQVSEGIINPHDIMETRGAYATQVYLATEIQKVYRSQGVSINSKHIEVIVRQMTQKIQITEMGDSLYLPNELIDIRAFNTENDLLESEDKAKALGVRVLLGITRSSLNTESFISASSFQETARVLADAAVKGKKDPMYGLKENVIIGKLIPAGLGSDNYNTIGVETTVSTTEQ